MTNQSEEGRIARADLMTLAVIMGVSPEEAGITGSGPVTFDVVVHIAAKEPGIGAAFTKT